MDGGKKKKIVNFTPPNFNGKCTECGSQISRKEDFVDHLLTHSIVQNCTTCPLCQEECESVQSLTLHFVWHAGLMSYTTKYQNSKRIGAVNEVVEKLFPTHIFGVKEGIQLSQYSTNRFSVSISEDICPSPNQTSQHRQTTGVTSLTPLRKSTRIHGRSRKELSVEEKTYQGTIFTDQMSVESRSASSSSVCTSQRSELPIKGLTRNQGRTRQNFRRKLCR